MRHFRVTEMATGDVTFAMGEDGDASPPGYDLALFSIEEVVEPDARTLQRETFRGDPAAAEAWALAQVEDDADQASAGDVGHIRRQVAITAIWHEVQLLKLAQATGNLPADAASRRKMLPTLMALVALTGNSLAQVSASMEARFWDRVRRVAIWEAKALLARDSVRAAQGVDAKMAAVEAVNWTQEQ